MYKVRLKDGQEFGPAAMDLILQWGREGRVPVDSLLVSEEDGSVQSVLAVPELAKLIQAPPSAASGEPAEEAEGSAMIPTRNPHALIGYYVGVASLIPFVGALAAPVAFILGISGIRKAKQNPKIHGTAHGVVAIVLACISLIGHVSCIIGIIMAANGP